VCIAKDLEEGSRGLSKLLLATEEIVWKPPLGEPLSRPKFEPDTFQIQAWRVTTKTTGRVWSNVIIEVIYWSADHSGRAV
jgi:hypothetical protein